MKRREFIYKSAAAALLPSLSLKSAARTKPLISDPSSPLPNLAQRKWMDLGFGLFIHHGINTYYDKEWSDGTLDPSAYNPAQLSTDQWCQAAKEAGMKYVVLVTKHHDGFCLWDTSLTDYSIKSAAVKKDVLAELANSAEKYGLKLGLYYSLWDRHEKSHDENIHAYVNDFMLPQLEELLTGYGNIVELWFDGFWKYQKHGWTRKNAELEGEAEKEEQSQERANRFIEAWRNEGAYYWQMDHVYQMIKSWQPDCLVMNNSTSSYPGVPLHPVDIRSGEKYTEVASDQKIWNWLGEDKYLPLQIETTMSVKGNERFKSGNWFWHDWDHSVASPDQIQSYLKVAQKMKANLLLNAGPSDKGLLRPEDEKLLKSLKS